MVEWRSNGNSLCGALAAVARRIDLQSMISTTSLLEKTTVYRLWQKPFENQKFAPLLAHNDFSRIRRVLDVGCGPGINTRFFGKSDYLGIDINARYISYAQRRYKRKFLVADVTRFSVSQGERFDFVLLNSFLHHVDDTSVRRILSHLCTVLTADGHIHILDLILPADPSIARFLARADRGEFPRPVEQWRDICSSIFDMVIFEAYIVGALKVPLWHMFYCKGRARQ
ncbi:MAG TPA: class I SAM-dependent methyltransferase [Candidatus Dormibacteraeota bacterium]|nr:class I SAM-dependent methyltransferase [Candidatus Dormibacteraeota bacterium]